jgi:hypothetical protein
VVYSSQFVRGTENSEHLYIKTKTLFQFHKFVRLIRWIEYTVLSYIEYMVITIIFKKIENVNESTVPTKITYHNRLKLSNVAYMF